MTTMLERDKIVSQEHNSTGDMRVLWLGIRQALIIALGAIDVYLGIVRTVTPKRKRETGRE